MISTYRSASDSNKTVAWSDAFYLKTPPNVLEYIISSQICYQSHAPQQNVDCINKLELAIIRQQRRIPLTNEYMPLKVIKYWSNILLKSIWLIKDIRMEIHSAVTAGLESILSDFDNVEKYPLDRLGLGLVLCLFRHVRELEYILENVKLREKLERYIELLTTVCTSIGESDILFVVLLECYEGHRMSSDSAVLSSIKYAMQVAHDKILSYTTGALPLSRSKSTKTEAKSTDNSSQDLEDKEADLPEWCEDNLKMLQYRVNEYVTKIENLIRGKIRYIESIDFDDIAQRWWDLDHKRGLVTPPDEISKLSIIIAMQLPNIWIGEDFLPIADVILPQKDRTAATYVNKILKSCGYKGPDIYPPLEDPMSMGEDLITCSVYNYLPLVNASNLNNANLNVKSANTDSWNNFADPVERAVTMYAVLGYCDMNTLSVLTSSVLKWSQCKSLLSESAHFWHKVNILNGKRNDDAAPRSKYSDTAKACMYCYYISRTMPSKSVPLQSYEFVEKPFFITNYDWPSERINSPCDFYASECLYYLLMTISLNALQNAHYANAPPSKKVVCLYSLPSERDEIISYNDPSSSSKLLSPARVDNHEEVTGNMSSSGDLDDNHGGNFKEPATVHSDGTEVNLIPIDGPASDYEDDDNGVDEYYYYSNDDSDSVEHSELVWPMRSSSPVEKYLEAIQFADINWHRIDRKWLDISLDSLHQCAPPEVEQTPLKFKFILPQENKDLMNLERVMVLSDSDAESVSDKSSSSDESSDESSMSDEEEQLSRDDVLDFLILCSLLNIVPIMRGGRILAFQYFMTLLGVKRNLRHKFPSIPWLKDLSINTLHNRIFTSPSEAYEWFERHIPFVWNKLNQGASRNELFREILAFINLERDDINPSMANYESDIKRFNEESIVIKKKIDREAMLRVWLTRINRLKTSEPLIPAHCHEDVESLSRKSRLIAFPGRPYSYTTPETAKPEDEYSCLPMLDAISMQCLIEPCVPTCDPVVPFSIISPLVELEWTQPKDNTHAQVLSDIDIEDVSDEFEIETRPVRSCRRSLFLNRNSIQSLIESDEEAQKYPDESSEFEPEESEEQEDSEPAIDESSEIPNEDFRHEEFRSSELNSTNLGILEVL